ncbi:uncharacterized protein [Musca autumnalis]|uniref:uncharacterized protein n=1 Tax=Musca autumnalis TaxID=221902 RepID=UPI003CEA4EDF
MKSGAKTKTQMKAITEREESLIKDFLRNKDVAPWFRGTSIFHLRGANQLFNAIRDDAEQRTSHRVKACLNLIGLEPIPSSKDLKFLMTLSRGNDLAFLWFLREMHYKNSDPKVFNLNEQLICSAICHLDMISTLRELDKILPKGGTSIDHPNAKNEDCRNEEETRLEGKTKSSDKKYVLPYFEKLTKPHSYGKPLTIDIPNFKVQFRTYASYADPNHTVCNESNRWFAGYDFNPGRRVAYQVIQNAIANIFENFQAVKLSHKSVDVLCAYHKAIKNIEDGYKNELRVQLRDKCLKKFFGNKREMVQKRKGLVKLSLHRAIEAQLCKIRKQTMADRRQFFLKTITSECNVVDVNVGGEFDGCCKKSIVADGTQMNEATKSSVTENLKQTNLGDNQINLLLNGKSPSQISLFAAKYIKNYDFGHVGETPKTSKTFFHGPAKHTPFMFDYKKIFQSKIKPQNEDWCTQAFLHALDKDIATLNELQGAASKLEVAAKECASNIWLKKLQKYQGEFDDSEKMLLSSWPLKQYPPDGKYDTEDRTLMDKMLADAFDYMRKNPKFVLVQLPEAHKLPMLREWIARRFGKVYTPKDRYDSYSYSLKVFHALDRMSFDFPTPTASQIGKNHFVSYNCKKYLGMKVDAIKRRFYRRLDTAIMKQSRTYWFAMRGYLCSGPGPPRQTFFAYMPSRLRDVQRFRLWRCSEHRPDKAAWDKRRNIQRSLKSDL